MKYNDVDSALEITDTIRSIGTFGVYSAYTTVTLSASSTTTTTISITIPTAYSYGAIIDGRSTANAIYVCNIYRSATSSDGKTITVTAALRNLTSSSATSDIYAYVLCGIIF